MKNTNTCPKCQSKDVVNISSQSSNRYTNDLPVGIWSWQTVPLARYVCVNCGFTEEWIAAQEHIEKIRAEYMT